MEKLHIKIFILLLITLRALGAETEIGGPIEDLPATTKPSSSASGTRTGLPNCEAGCPANVIPPKKTPSLKSRFFAEVTGQFAKVITTSFETTYDGSVSSSGYNDSVQTSYPSISAPGFKIQGGFEILPNLPIILNYSFRSVSWTKRNLTITTPGSLVSYYGSQIDTNSRFQNSFVMLGIRPQLDLFGGHLYSGLFAGICLPFNSSADVQITYSGSTSSSFLSSISGKSRFNLGLAIEMQFGYKYPIHDQIYLTVDIFATFVSTNNIGQTSDSTSTYLNGQVKTSTTSYTDSLSLADNDRIISGQTPSINRYTTFTPISAGISLGVGYKFGAL